MAVHLPCVNCPSLKQAYKEPEHLIAPVLTVSRELTEVAWQCAGYGLSQQSLWKLFGEGCRQSGYGLRRPFWLQLRASVCRLLKDVHARAAAPEAFKW